MSGPGTEAPNQSIEPTGGSRFCLPAFVCQWRLPPVAHASLVENGIIMSTKRVLAVFGVIALAVSLPFVVIHLMAAPDDAPITPLQHAAAALANYLGPWGVALVRLVNFPNAGLRSFSWGLAAGLTLLGAALVILPLWTQRRSMQIVLCVLWGMFVVVWFGVGLGQIASGLL